MSDSSSESLHQAIQQSLNAGDFERVSELSSALGDAIIREAQAIGPSERSAVVRKGLNRLRDHLSLARVLRAHVATKLQDNTTISLYQQCAGRSHSWRFDA
jgi:hypothetical protein